MAAEAFFRSDYFCPLDRSAKAKQAREENQRLQKELRQQLDDNPVITITTSSSSSTTKTNTTFTPDKTNDDAASIRTTNTTSPIIPSAPPIRRTATMPTTIGRGGVGNWVPPEIVMSESASVLSMASTRRGPAPRPVSSMAMTAIPAAAATAARHNGRGGLGNYLLPGKTAAEKEAEARAVEEERLAREKDIELEVMHALAEPLKAHLRGETVEAED